MRPTLAAPYGAGLLAAFVIAYTQLDGDARIAAVSAVGLAAALLMKWQFQRLIHADAERFRLQMVCDRCQHTRREHWGERCPGGSRDHVFTRADYGLAR